MSGLPDIPFTIGSVHVLKKTIRRLDLHPGMNILDAGCGPGQAHTSPRTEVGPDGEVTAIGIQEGMLHETQERVKNLTSPISVSSRRGNARAELLRPGRAGNRACRDPRPGSGIAGDLQSTETRRYPPRRENHPESPFLSPAVRSPAWPLSSVFVEKEFSGNHFSCALIPENLPAPDSRIRKNTFFVPVMLPEKNPISCH